VYPLDVIAPYLPNGNLSVRSLRNATNVAWYRAQQWVKAGWVDEATADLLACRLGVHPSAIWDQWWDAA
jgi:lambda repressor-like predicted transcriptional regulator